MEKLDLNNENVINNVQNEPVLWNTSLNASEEQKDLVWKRLSDLFGVGVYIGVVYTINIYPVDGGLLYMLATVTSTGSRRYLFQRILTYFKSDVI